MIKYIVCIGAIGLYNLPLHGQGLGLEWGARPPKDPHVNYYHFYKGVQLIEVDKVGRWEWEVLSLDMKQPRELSWSAVLQRPVNPIIVRDSTGKILRQFNSPEPYKDSDFIAPRKLRGKTIPHKGRFFTRPIEQSYIYPATAKVNAVPGYIYIQQKSGRMGYIDTLGNIALPMVYTGIYPGGDSLFILQQNDTVQLVDWHFKPLIKAGKYQLLQYMDKGIYLAGTQAGYTLINRHDAEITKNKYDEIRPLYPALFAVRKGNKYGLMNAQGLELTGQVYRHIENFDRGYAKVQQEEVGVRARYNTGLIDSTGREVLNTDYSEIVVISIKPFIAKVTGVPGAYYVDGQGQVILFFGSYQQVGLPSEGRVAVKRGGKWGYVDMVTGRQVIDFIYDNAGEFRQGFATVGITDSLTRNLKYGYIHKSGRWAIPPIYKKPHHFVNGKATAWLNDTIRQLSLPAVSAADSLALVYRTYKAHVLKGGKDITGESMIALPKQIMPVAGAGGAFYFPIEALPFEAIQVYVRPNDYSSYPVTIFTNRVKNDSLDIYVRIPERGDQLMYDGLSISLNPNVPLTYRINTMQVPCHEVDKALDSAGIAFTFRSCNYVKLAREADSAVLRKSLAYLGQRARVEPVPVWSAHEKQEGENGIMEMVVPANILFNPQTGEAEIMALFKKLGIAKYYRENQNRHEEDLYGICPKYLVYLPYTKREYAKILSELWQTPAVKFLRQYRWLTEGGMKN